MHLIAVEYPTHSEHKLLIEAMLRLRAKVFADRLNWQVDSRDGLERDSFDDEDPTYILAVEDDRQVVGCVRLLLPMRSSMLVEVFPELLDESLRPHERMIESSRFCVDKDLLLQSAKTGNGCAVSRGAGGDTGSAGRSVMQLRTRMLLAGILEWGLMHGYDELVTATDLRFERLLKIAGWPLRRLGQPRMINETRSIAGSLQISTEIFRSLRPDGYRPLVDTMTIAG